MIVVESLGGGESIPHRVTAITAQQRNENRVNISVDGKYAFSLDIAQVVDLGVKVGIELSDERLAELKLASAFGKVYARALEWSLSRPRSVRELRDYLWRKEREKPGVDMELVLQRLVDKGYVDDEKFAQHWVENRFTSKGISIKRLRLELRQKGVADALIERTVADGDRDDCAEIMKVINKKRRLYDDDKLLAYLIRQGFDYQLAREMISQQSLDF